MPFLAGGRLISERGIESILTSGLRSCQGCRRLIESHVGDLCYDCAAEQVAD